MCTGFTTDVIWMNTMCAVLLANHLRAVADAFRPLMTRLLLLVCVEASAHLYSKEQFLKAV